ALWRDELAEVLAAIAAAHEGEADLSALDRAAVRPQPRIRVSPQSGDHLSRLISAASYVMSRDEVQLAELSEALGVSEKQLITDLQVLFVCGDMGAGWEDLIEAEWEHGTVRVRTAEPLQRALDLSAVRAAAQPAAAPRAPTRAESAEATAAAAGAARTPDRAEGVLAAGRAALRAAPGAEDANLAIRYSAADRAGTSVRRIRPLRIETSG